MYTSVHQSSSFFNTTGRLQVPSITAQKICNLLLTTDIGDHIVVLANTLNQSLFSQVLKILASSTCNCTLTKQHRISSQTLEKCQEGFPGPRKRSAYQQGYSGLKQAGQTAYVLEICC